MKKILTFVFSLFLSISIFESFAIEQINLYKTILDINTDGTVAVTEQIDYDFGSDSRHGIFRDIPFIKENENGEKYKLDIYNISVTNPEGHPYKYTTSKSTDTLSIKIGDPNTYVTGKQTYHIKYEVSGAITYFSDHDEIYWNMLGNNWSMRINNFEGVIGLPDNIPNSELSGICYTGRMGSSAQECETSVENNNVVITSNKAFSPYEGLTAAVSFPKGYVEVLEPEKYYLIHPVLAVFLVILGIGYYILLPLKLLFDYLKDKSILKNNAREVAAWFDPPKDASGKLYLSAEASLLLDPKVDQKKVTATLVQLAQKGYIKIHFEESTSIFRKDKVKLEKIKEFDSSLLKDYELSLLESLFTSNETIVDLSKLKYSGTFVTKYNAFKKQLGSVLKNYGDTSKKVSDVENLTGGLVALSMFTLNIPLLISVILFVRKNLKFTVQGAENYGIAKSLKNFLVSQDAQLDFQADKQLFFERLLPYATAFGVEDVWIKRFPDLDFSKIDWYEGNTNYLAISSMTSSMNSSLSSVTTTSSSSSSGFSSGFSGGSSGGGGGGGGGGSW